MGLSPLAYASAPDPLWIPGFDDGAGHDHVVVFLANTGADIDRPLEGVGRLCLVVGLLLNTPTPLLMVQAFSESGDNIAAVAVPLTESSGVTI
jgi:hypothetical protein